MSPDPTIAVGALVASLGSLMFAVRQGAAARRSRFAARIATRTQETLVATIRELIAASRASPSTVLAVVDRAVRACVPTIETVAFLERRDDVLCCTYATGERMEFFRGRFVPLAGDDVCARAVRAGFRCIARRPEPVLHPSDAMTLAIPFSATAGAFAVWAAGSRVGLRPAEVELVVALVEQATPAYLLALEREDDRRRATVDGLTGLLTGSVFRRRLREMLDRRPGVRPFRLAVLFVDTDHFKTWNDRYGHAAGDGALRRLAAILRDHAAAEQDLVARNGGDEFCLVFVGVEKSEAIERARALCAAIAAHRWAAERPRIDGDGGIEITASIGVAAFPRDARTAEDLLERADAAMYHSKRSGRNRVSYYDETREQRLVFLQ